ncbi:hypothetical protein BDF19DRAFT_425551 [Syncephalis fuscata]|nr:hypothetical protein BDF19DRAFT_425551 [Syncephalis fuscata]
MSEKSIRGDSVSAVRLPAFIGQEHEPRILIILRFVTISLFLGAFAAYGCYQVTDFIYTYAERIYYEERPLIAPEIALYIPTALLENSNVSLIGWQFSSDTNLHPIVYFEEGKQFVREDATGRQQLLPLNIATMDNDSKNGLRLVTRPLTAIRTTPDYIWTYGRSDKNSLSPVLTAIDLLITPNRNSGIPDILNQENIKLIMNPRVSSDITLADIDQASSITEANIRWGNSYSVSFTQAIRKSATFKSANNAKERVSFSMTVSPLVGSITSGISIRIIPKNAFSKDGWLFKVHEYGPEMRWLDLITRIVISAIVLFAFYVFLFGHFRLRPWGLMQRYILRKNILHRLPSNARVAIPPFRILPKKHVRSTAPLYINQPRVTTSQRTALASNTSTNHPSTIIQRMNALEARLGTHAVELGNIQMLQHRTLAFYHRDDLFYVSEPIADYVMDMEEAPSVQTNPSYRESYASSWISGSVPLSTHSSQESSSCYSSYETNVTPTYYLQEGSR